MRPLLLRQIIVRDMPNRFEAVGRRDIGVVVVEEFAGCVVLVGEVDFTGGEVREGLKEVLEEGLELSEGCVGFEDYVFVGLVGGLHFVHAQLLVD
jgi:hypothetical protein